MECLNCKIEMFNYDVATKHAQLSYDTCEQCGSLFGLQVSCWQLTSDAQIAIR